MKAEAQAPAVLEPILAATRQRVAALGDPPVTPRGARPSFRAALEAPAVGVIAEIKRRSPSAGAIRVNADVAFLSAAYVRGGARAISVLTEPTHFGGSMDDLTAASRYGLPILCKDFVIDERQLQVAAAAGASAALLIVRILGRRRLEELLAEAGRVGLDALVEVHTGAELDTALAAGATIVGVNARDLDTLAMDPERALSLLPRVPPGVIGVAESGIAHRSDVERYRDAGAEAVLVGTAVAGAADPEAAVRALAAVAGRRAR